MSTHRPANPWKLLILLALLLPTGSREAHAKPLELQVLFESGLEGADHPGVVFEDFQPHLAAIAANGTVVFGATREGADPGLFTLGPDGLHERMREGQPVPGLDGPTWSDPLSSHAIVDAAGRIDLFAGAIDPVTFRAKSWLLGVPTGLEAPGVLWGPEGQLGGMPAPPAKSIRHGLTGAGRIFRVRPSQSFGESWLAWWPEGAPAPEVLVREVYEVPAVGGDTTVQLINGARLNEAGQVGVVLSAYDRTEREYFTAVLRHEAQGGWTVVADDRELAGFLQVADFQMDAEGQLFYSGTPAADFNEGVFRFSSTYNVEIPLVVEGETAPGSNGATFASIDEWTTLPGGQVAVLATLSDGRRGAWRTEGNAPLPIAIAGEDIPDQPGLQFGDPGQFAASAFGSICSSPAGHVVFTSRVSGSGVNAQSTGVFRWFEGRLDTVLRSNMSIDGQPIHYIDLAGSPFGTGGYRELPSRNAVDGARHAVDEDGRVLLGATTADYSTHFLLLAESALVVNSTGDRPDADPGDGVCSCDPLPSVPEGSEPECTLRAAIEQANADGDHDNIRFDIPGLAPWEIVPATPLPAIDSHVSIAATPGFWEGEGYPEVILDGRDVGGTGLVLAPLPAGRGAGPVGSTSNSTLRGLGLERFDTGVRVEQDGAVLDQLYIGVDSWLEGLDPGRAAVRVLGASGVRIESCDLDATDEVVRVDDGAQGTVLRGNRLGRDPQRSTSAPRAAAGLVLTGAHGSQVGGPLYEHGNELRGLRAGAILSQGSRDNRFHFNRFGGDPAGGGPKPLEDFGVLMLDAPANHIGGATEQAGSGLGNSFAGVPVAIELRGAGSLGNRVQGNLIGETLEGTADSTCNQVGVRILAGAAGTLVGGGPGEGNEIVFQRPGSRGSGSAIVLRHASGTTVAGNELYRPLTGIELEGGQGIRIEANAITGARRGLLAQGAPSAGTVVALNTIASGRSDAVAVEWLAGTDGQLLGNTIESNLDGIAVGAGAGLLAKDNDLALIGRLGLVADEGALAVDARLNWWGDGSGPSGIGPGTGSNLQGGVQYDPWLGVAPGFLASTGSEASGEPGEEIAFWSWFSNPSDTDTTLALAVLDSLGWDNTLRRGRASLQLVVPAGGLAAARASFTVPPGAEGQQNAVRLEVDGVVVARSTLLSYTPQLARVEAVPGTATLLPGTTLAMGATGFDQFDHPMGFAPQWQATGGTISGDGTYTAPASTGDYVVTVADGPSGLQDQVLVEVTNSVGIDDDEDDRPGPVLPARLALAQNAPNPFNPSTTIAFDLPRAMPVQLAIYNLRGERVRTLVAGEELPAGEHRRSWRGEDDRGRPVASGVYVYRLLVPGRVFTKQMVLLQ